MRRLIALAAVLAVTSLQAQELKFGDVNYFLKKGEIQLSLDANQTYQKSRRDNEPLATAEKDIETRGFLFQGSAFYAVTDRLNIFVNQDYAHHRYTRDRTTDPAPNNFYSDGLANPSAGANFRLLNQISDRYNLDFGAVARVNLEDAERGSIGTNSKDGNFAYGRSSIELNSRIGRKWNEANEWQLAAGVVAFNEGETTFKNQTGDLTVDEDASLDIFLRATYQYRPVNEFMMLLSAQATRVGKVEGKDNNGANWEYDSHIDYDFGFTAKYLITSNFIGRFDYHIFNNANFDATIEGTSDKIKKRHANYYGLGVDFLF